MTGGEIIAGVSAAAAVAKKLTNDTSDKKALQKIAADSPSMTAAAETYARRQAVKQQVIFRAWQPLARFLHVGQAYFEDEFTQDLTAKIGNIPDEQIITPSASVAVPAMQGLSYSVEEPELKEMYLSLLATATDARVSRNAHPSFAEIIKQITPAEASLLLDLLGTMDYLPIARLRLRTDVDSETEGESEGVRSSMPLFEDVVEGVIPPGTPRDEPLLPTWVDNWVRLGLIEVDYTRQLVGADTYAWVTERPEFKRLAATNPRGVEGIVKMEGFVGATDFGRRFRTAVSYDGMPIPGTDDPSDRADAESQDPT